MFFKKVISSLNEGGVWMYPNLMEVFTMSNGKLVASDEKALKAVRKLVSKKAGEKLFTL